MSGYDTYEDIQAAMSRGRTLTEAMRNLDDYKTAEEIAAVTKNPRSSTYKILKELETIGVVNVSYRHELSPTGRNVRVKTYRVNPFKADEYSKPILGETIPFIYNKLSKKTYTLLDLAARYDPNEKTGGARAADSYLAVSVLLLALAFEAPDSVESAKKRLELRQYLQQALASVKNVSNSIEQMLDDPRLWTEDLHVLAVNEQVKQNKDLINDRASRITI